MSEFIARLNFEGGEQVEVTRDMARLYTHMGAAAVYDHVFIVTDYEANEGLYVWAQIPPDNPSCQKYSIISLAP